MKNKWFHCFYTILKIEWFGAELNSIRSWIGLLVNPVAYLALLGVGLASTIGYPGYLDFIFPGVIVMQASGSINRVVARTVAERRWGLAAFKLQAHTPYSAYFIGMMIPGIVIYIVQTLLLCGIGFCLGVSLSIQILLISIFIGIIAVWFWECFGYSLAGVIRNYQVRDLVLRLLIMPLTFSAPIFYSLDQAPLFLKILGSINPLTYQVNLARSTFQGNVDTVSICFVIITLIIISIFGIVSTYSMKKLSFEG